MAESGVLEPVVSGDEGTGGMSVAPSSEARPGNVSQKPSYMPLQAGPKSRRRGCGGTPVVGGCCQKPPKFNIGIDEVKDPDFGRMLGAEYVGTMFLVFIGVISCISASSSSGALKDIPKHLSGLIAGPFTFIEEDGNAVEFYMFDLNPDKLHVSFAFGIVVATMAQALGHISGAHLNPAVSLGLMMAGKCSLLKFVCYFFAQLFGAITGGLLVWLSSNKLRMTGNPHYLPNGKIARVYEKFPNWGMGVTVLAPGVVQFPDGMMTEFMLTFLLVFTVCAVCDDLRKDIKGSAPLAIGLAVFVCHAAGIGFTGSSVNPVRSLGSAIFSDHTKAWTDQWVYWIGPLMGALEAGCTYAVIFRTRAPVTGDRHVSPESMAP